MRFWKNAAGDVITDEQVLAYLSAHGSLSRALESGDVVCISDASAQQGASHSPRRKTKGSQTCLADFLKQVG